MNDPLILLFTGTVVIALFAAVFWPNKGIVSVIKMKKNLTARTLIEDALKYLYNCEYNSVECSVNGIAGNLSISADEAAKLAARLESMGLISSYQKSLQLTDEGRSYALRIIRIHRLWEKYLADETGVEELEWHSAAEEIEHRMTPAEADLLAAQIGNPVFDPHGDPIPSSAGVLPEQKGRPLSELKTGEFASITHIEDEPQAIYQQIVAEGLYPGMQVRMLESAKERIRFTANGEEVVLAPLFAKNITVTPLKSEMKIEGRFKRLSSLSIGETGTVLGISRACRGQQRRRLLDLGIVPGTRVTAEFKSAGGDPVAYRIKGATVALRKKQADRVYLIPNN